MISTRSVAQERANAQPTRTHRPRRTWRDTARQYDGWQRDPQTGGYDAPSQPRAVVCPF